MITMPTPITATSSSGPRSVRILPSESGKRAAIEVKIRIDMPLPTPRSVMSSPSHMMTPVPAVIVMTMSRMAYQESLAMSSPHAPWSLPKS
jgi:hypothetical protein